MGYSPWGRKEVDMIEQLTLSWSVTIFLPGFPRIQVIVCFYLQQPDRLSHIPA